MKADFLGSRPGELDPQASGTRVIFCIVELQARSHLPARTRGHAIVELRQVVECTKLGASLTCRIPQGRWLFESRPIATGRHVVGSR